jgi:hypothetical protein
MDTHPNPKVGQPIEVLPISVSEADRRIIAECFHDGGPSEALVAAEIIDAIESLLTAAANRMARSDEIRLPSQKKATIAPVAKMARSLAEALHPSRWAAGDYAELGATSDELLQAHIGLAQLARKAEAAMARLDRVSSSGMNALFFSSALNNATETLGRIFDHARPVAEGEDAAERAGSREEFIEVCRKYLPKSSRGRKPASADPSI